MVPGYAPDPWRHYSMTRVAALASMPEWAAKALCDMYTDYVSLQWTSDYSNADIALEEEKFIVKNMLHLLDTTIPTSTADLIIFMTVLTHICYIYTLTSADPFLNDKINSDSYRSNFYAREV